MRFVFQTALARASAILKAQRKATGGKSGSRKVSKKNKKAKAAAASP